MSRGQHIEFDKDQLMAALMGGLNLNDCEPEDIENLKVGAEEQDIEEFAQEKKIELIKEQSERDMGYNLAAIGAMRIIGPLTIDCTLGNLVLLDIIDSPFVNGLEETVSIEDVAKTLYVLSQGQDVLKPLMEIAGRIEDLYKLKDMAKGNPDLCKEIVNRVEKISEARIRFAEDALDFYNQHFITAQVQEVFDGIYDVISDVMKGLEEVAPEAVGQSEDKKKLNQDQV